MINSNTPEPVYRGEVSVVSKFLWWLSTAEEELIANAVIDRNRYRIIGISVLCTWVFASLAWTYFFSTVMDNVLVAVLLGLFMGFVILSIDRALIKGITQKNKRKFSALAFRAILALTIGMFMAQPAVLYIFDQEIKMQTSLDNEKKKILKRTDLDALYKNQIADLQQQKTVLQNELSDKYNEVAQARQNFLAESDGSGGTGKIGISSIALAKKHEYEKLDAEYKQLEIQQSPKIDSSEKALLQIQSDIKKAEAEFTTYLNNGFLTRIEALNNLLKTNTALQSRYYLIVFILMLIELMPVIAKSALPAGTYEAKVVLQESMESELAEHEIEQQTALRKMIVQQTFETDGAVVQEFFKETADLRKQKIKSMGQAWSQQDNLSFEGLWKKLKHSILNRQG